MEWTEEILTKIDRYISGQSDREEQQWIESQCQANPEFQVKIETLRKIRISSRLSQLRSQFNQLNVLENQLQKREGQEGDLDLNSPLITNDVNQNMDADDLTSKEGLKKHYSKQDIFYAGIRSYWAKHLWHQMESIEDELNTETLAPNQNPKSKLVPFHKQRRRFFLISLAAGIAILILAFWPWISPDWNERIYHQYYMPYAYNPTTRNGNKIDRIIPTYYNKQNYTSVLEELNSRISLTSEEKLIKAICLMEEKQFTAALKILESLENSDLKETSSWYKAMIAVHQNQLDQAKKYLEEIPKSSLYKAKERRKIVSQIKFRTLFN